MFSDYLRNLVNKRFIQGLKEGPKGRSQRLHPTSSRAAVVFILYVGGPQNIVFARNYSAAN